jgi:large subunit ribosomal protein L29
VKTERLRELTRSELAQKRRDIEQELFNLQIRRSLQPPDNPLLFRTLRRQLARVLTILHEDEKHIRPLDSHKEGLA